MLPLDSEIIELSTALDPPTLRSLDALHLATALSAREEIGVIVSYDDRLRDAAESHGFETASPAD